jgi:hypothetical protein
VKKLSRLRKKAAMDMNSFQSVISQTSKKGRDILKTLEDFKFTLEQTARLVKNNQQLAQGMITKRKSIDEISNKLYQIVFDIENMDISDAFQNQNPAVMQDMPNKDPNEQPPGGPPTPGMPGGPGAPGTPPMNGQPPAGPAGQPPTPGAPPTNGGDKSEDKPEDEEDNSEDKDDKSKDKREDKSNDEKDEKEDK